MMTDEEALALGRKALSEALVKLSKGELNSVRAMLSYISSAQKVHEKTVKMIVESEFQVEDISDIKRPNYMAAIEFLVDFEMDKKIN